MYLLTMESFPKTILDKYMNGEHVVRPHDGLFKKNLNEMVIESTYKKTMKVPIREKFSQP